MRSNSMIPLAIFFLVAVPVHGQQQTQNESWPQWGGPDRSFRVPGTALKKSWDKDGPTIKWKRNLGGGYAGIASSNGCVFTTIRKDGREIDIALDLETGKTVWSQAIEVAERNLDYGMGPFATPLINDDRIIFLGGTGILRSRQSKTGQLKWKLELEKEYKIFELKRGFGESPLFVDGSLILPIGAQNAGVIAIDADNGNVNWARHDFRADYASPLLVTFPDSSQVLCHMENELVSVDSIDGSLRWSVPSDSTRTQHVISPIMIGDNTVLASTTYGVKAYRLKSHSRPELIWESNRIRSQVGNLIFIPNQQLVLGATGASTGSPIVALDSETGMLLWKSRGMECGFLWQVGNRLFSLSRSGRLVQGFATRKGLEVIATHQVFDEAKVWSAPAVLAKLLVVKSQDRIIAFDLGK